MPACSIKKSNSTVKSALVAFLLLLSPGAAVAQYVGSAACGTCHAAKFSSQSKSGHAHALAHASPGYVGEWAFGAGKKAITYVSQADSDNYLEHGLSYYSSIKGTAMTPGHVDTSGVRYPTFDAEATTLKCFRCHSTGQLSLGAGYKIQPSELGIHCEACHGAGAAHVNAKGAAGTIRNPKQLTAVELNELCGTCHRPPGSDDWTDPWKTRHQPSYLTQSACFRKSNGALSCVTCHDPHEPLMQKAASYDTRCISCHRAIRHRVSVASRTCVDCHMPQVKVSAQLNFTNHWIGIYKTDSKLVPSESLTKNVPPIPVMPGRPEWENDSSSLRTLFEQALTVRETELGPNDPKVARNASALGLFLSKSGPTADAEAPLRKALQIDRAGSHAFVAADEENLASVLQGAGKMEEAFELFQRASQGPDSAVAARSFATLARMDPEHAEEYYRSAIAAEETASGRDNRKVAVLLDDLAVTLQARKDYAGAEPLFRRALAIQQQSIGPDSPAAGSTLSNLGTLLQSKGDLVQAEQLERTAVRIFEQKLGPYNAELATACTNLADVLWSKKELPTAAALYRRAIAIDETVYGADHPEVAGDLVNLGLLLKDLGEHSNAALTLHRALSISEKSFGPNSPQALQIRRELPAGAH